MQHIARLLDIPGPAGPPSPAYTGSGIYINRGLARGNHENRPLFNTSKGPGFATPRRDTTPNRSEDASTSRVRRDCENPVRLITEQKRNGSKSRDSSKNRSRDGSPRMPRPRSEEIPLELIKKTPNSCIDTPKISIISRPQTPRSEQDNVIAETSTSGVSNDENINNEETSFIAQQNSDKKPKRKGAIETV